MASTPNHSTHSYTGSMSNQEFQTLSRLVYDQCGINLTPAKKVMVEIRLNKRLRALQMETFKEYIQLIHSKEGIEQELVHMIDVVTTNKTDFFREPHHFDYLRSAILPDFQDQNRGNRPFRVWSSACSSGEEPYTLAMVLQEFATVNSSFSYTISASDISTHVLNKAELGVYTEAQVAPVPTVMKQRYLLKSKDREKPTVRVVQSLRDKVNFFRINLMDSAWKMDEQDIIFCRNVLIYFDRKTQYDVVGKLVDKLKPGGFLIIGHSESLHQFDLPIQQVKPTIFSKI